MRHTLWSVLVVSLVAGDALAEGTDEAAVRAAEDGLRLATVRPDAVRLDRLLAPECLSVDDRGPVRDCAGWLDPKSGSAASRVEVEVVRISHDTALVSGRQWRAPDNTPQRFLRTYVRRTAGWLLFSNVLVGAGPPEPLASAPAPERTTYVDKRRTPPKPNLPRTYRAHDVSDLERACGLIEKMVVEAGVDRAYAIGITRGFSAAVVSGGNLEIPAVGLYYAIMIQAARGMPKTDAITELAKLFEKGTLAKLNRLAAIDGEL